MAKRGEFFPQRRRESLTHAPNNQSDSFKKCRTFVVPPSFCQITTKEKALKPLSFKAFPGGDNRTRICDLSRVRRALYQLSYASIW